MCTAAQLLVTCTVSTQSCTQLADAERLVCVHPAGEATSAAQEHAQQLELELRDVRQARPYFVPSPALLLSAMRWH